LNLKKVRFFENRQFFSGLISEPGETPQVIGWLEEAPGSLAASEQPKQRFSIVKTRTNDTWLEIKDRALFARFFLHLSNETASLLHRETAAML
jgi:hypothetical protein